MEAGSGVVKVVSPIDDTPAARAGLMANDLITHLDGEQIVGLTLEQAVEKMRGPVNTSITLTILRRGKDEPFDVKIMRDVIRINAIKARLEGDIIYVKISTFNEQTHTNLQKQIEALKKSLGRPARGFVIDLRNNPGGLLDQAINVSDAFLDKGAIVLTKGRLLEETQRANARAGDIADGKPIVVLVNGGSASASEIVAGALQDHKRATVIGTRSFGKGSVQTIIPLGSNGAIRLTTARYYTPSGRSIQAKGIEPDIAVEPAKIERVAQTGPVRREADLRGALRNTDRGAAPDRSGTPPQQPAPGTPPGSSPTPPKGDEGSVDPAVLGTSEDYQLARALDMLRGVALFHNRVAN
jgi:carboxyl-terminal processing protease